MDPKNKERATSFLMISSHSTELHTEADEREKSKLLQENFSLMQKVISDSIVLWTKILFKNWKGGEAKVCAAVIKFVVEMGDKRDMKMEN